MSALKIINARKIEESKSFVLPIVPSHQKNTQSLSNMHDTSIGSHKQKIYSYNSPAIDSGRNHGNQYLEPINKTTQISGKSSI